MSITYARIELLRTIRNVPNVFFIALLPGIFYLVFGAMQEYGSETAGDGNVAAAIMTSMAAYGAAVATMTIGGSVAVEQFQGWGRQLALTPMSTQGFVTTKAVVAMVVALMPIGVVYATGALTGAEATARVWVLSAAAIWAGSVIFALFGLAIGFAFRTEAALSAAGGALVILAFLGNVFIPLSGTMLDIGKLTPMYGMVALARYPQTEGVYATSAGEPLWIPIANIIAWTIILGAAAALLSRRGRQRQ
ncbi:ABC transporter permease [Hoyosella sp. G463]|uniref:ABC transporter permease n=1 Tax=Lolliginicoccus lacisalsi TaxID=2742202 RepID=A0A927PNE2_9ACTN|nr:ABC transporter permease [Lolliginicoccus lacisalsi]MBD8507651.1 ABC transporter permease [Lolliginicoccus lacisalsi]